MICLVLVKSQLFPLPCGVGSTVPREGCNLSVIILASFIVRLSDVGLPSLVVAALQYFTFFSSRIHIFNHSYLCTLASRGTLPSAFGVNIQI